MSTPLDRAYNEGREAWYTGAPMRGVWILEAAKCWELGYRTQEQSDPHKRDNSGICPSHDVQEV